MTTLSAHTTRAIHNKGMQAVYGIAAEYDVPVEDVIALLGTTSHTSISSAHSPFTRLESTTLSDIGMTISTPSQPEGSSYPHAPAAVTTDGQGLVSSRPLPSVEPITESAAPAATPAKPTGSQAKHAAEEPSPDGSGGVQDRCESTPPTPSKRMTKREQVRECNEQHPDWTSHQIAEHLGFGLQHVQIMASHLGLKLAHAPKVSPTNMRDKLFAVIAANPGLTVRQLAEVAGCSHVTAAKWAKEAAERPQEAERPSDEPQAAPEPELPPLSTPSERLLPPVERDVTDVLHRPHRAPQGRFYLREKSEPGQPTRFVHQSLQPSPTGPGPLMTLDRKWAWYDTMERYRGAKKKWPELATMRKEAAAS